MNEWEKKALADARMDIDYHLLHVSELFVEGGMHKEMAQCDLAESIMYEKTNDEPYLVVHKNDL